MIRSSFLSALLGLLALLGSAPGKAESVDPDRQAVAGVEILVPGWLRNLEHLYFGALSVTTAGTAVLNPDTETLTTTGGVVLTAGIPHAAYFEAVSPKKGVVIVRLPKNPSTLTRVGGTETMTVSNWTMSGGKTRRNVAAKEPFDFKVGGTLNVNANQREGTYVGTFAVEVQYP